MADEPDAPPTPNFDPIAAGMAALYTLTAQAGGVLKVEGVSCDGNHRIFIERQGDTITLRLHNPKDIQ